jgi:hypothetical protein
VVLEHSDRNLASFTHPTSNTYTFYNTVPDDLKLPTTHEQLSQISKDAQRRAAAHNTKQQHVET